VAAPDGVEKAGEPRASPAIRIEACALHTWRALSAP
jgi:hypothetical protein